MLGFLIFSLPLVMLSVLLLMVLGTLGITWWWLPVAVGYTVGGLGRELYDWMSR